MTHIQVASRQLLHRHTPDISAFLCATEAKWTHNSPSFCRIEKACSCIWLILFCCKTLKKSNTYNAITYLFTTEHWFRSYAHTSNTRWNGFSSVNTYRTVSILQEQNETFPMVSIRFASKSLKVMKRARTGRIKQKGSNQASALLAGLLLTASSKWAFPDRCHPAWLTSCSSWPCQSARGSVTTCRRHVEAQKCHRETHSKTSESSPENVRGDIFWMLLFSRILQQVRG